MPEAKPLARLRPMTASDLDVVVAIEAASYPDPWSANTFADCLEADAKGYRCCVLLADEQIIGHGVFTVVLDEAELLNFCLAPERRGQAMAAGYLDQLQHLMVSYGARRLFLEVRQSNTPARRLYRSAGLQEVGVRNDYYPAQQGREDAILMVKDLSG